MQIKIKFIFCIVLFFFSSFLWSAEATKPVEKSKVIDSTNTNQESLTPNKPSAATYPNHIQAIIMAGIWKETTLLERNDGATFKINTLNTVARLGLIYTFSNALFFTRYGFVVGQSENMSDVDNFSYFQRSVSLSGVEIGAGVNLFRGPNISLGLALGGIYRIIKHTLPGEEYRFKTSSRGIPHLSLESNWKFSQRWNLRQSVGTQGFPLDTLWSFGFGFLF